MYRGMSFFVPAFPIDGSTRTAPIAKTLKKLKLDGMIIIGGDGSFRGGTKLMKEFNLPVVGVPATIDNDIPGHEFLNAF